MIFGGKKWTCEVRVIFGCYHYSNFEWIELRPIFSGLLPLTAQEFKNPLLDPIFVRLRETAGHRVVAREGAVLHLYKALRRGGTRGEVPGRS